MQVLIGVALLALALLSCAGGPAARPPPPAVVARSGSADRSAVAPAPWSFVVADGEVEALTLDAAGNVYLLVSYELEPDDWDAEAPLSERLHREQDVGLMLLAFAADGRQRWVRRFDSRFIRHYRDRIFLAAGGDLVVIAGGLEGGADFGGARLTTRGAGRLGQDVVVAALDGDGDHVYSFHLGDARTQDVHALTVLSDGTAVLAGSYQGSLEVEGVAPAMVEGSRFLLAVGRGGKVRWGRRIAVDASSRLPMQLMPAGASEVALMWPFTGVVDLGTGPIVANENFDAIAHNATLLARLDSRGQPRWVDELPHVHEHDFSRGGTHSLTGAYFAAVPGGGWLVAGTASGAFDLGGGTRRRTDEAFNSSLFVVRLAADGAYVRDFVMEGVGERIEWTAAASAGVAIAASLRPLGSDTRREYAVVQLDPELVQRSRTAAAGVRGLAFDPWGRLLVVSDKGIAMMSDSGRWLDCRGASECSQHGRCTVVEGDCQATRIEDCASSRGCIRSGRCRPVAGRCVVVDDTDCSASELCNMSRLCETRDGECVLGLGLVGCSAWYGCRDGGFCLARDHKCVRAPGYDCAQSPECRQSGHCAPGDSGGLCSVGSNADCRRSSGCLNSGECVSAPSSLGGSCRLGNAADCLKSRDCRRYGRCGYEIHSFGARCKVLSEEMCRASEGCRRWGRCTIVEGSICEARRDKDCAKSEACSERGRCRFEARRCVR